MSNWQAIVASRWPDARVQRVEELAGDASTRRYARLHVSGADAATMVAMILPDESRAWASDELTADGAEKTELPFLNVQRYLAAHGIPVPAILHVAEREHGVLLLEDLGDVSLAAAAESAGEELPRLLGSAAETLARIAALVGSPDPRCIAFQQTYDRDLIARELEVASSYGLAESDLGPPRDASADREMAEALAILGDQIAAQPLVLMHRDYHAWNLLVDGAGRVRVIDFQDALLGPALYDLASLCTDRDSHRFIDPAAEAMMVERFGDELEKHGVRAYAGDPEALRRDYFRAVTYRTLRVIGRFRYLAIERGKPGYLVYLPGMARQTRRALDALGDERLARLLAARSAHFA